ncbi:MAG: pentapeptide repeat-containing protein [Hormoscilla sp.]
MPNKLSKQELLSRYAAGERNFQASDLTGLNLSGVSLPGIDLTRSVLSRADLTEADLSDSILVSANLSSTILNRVNLNRANLTRANMKRSLLTKASLEEALLLQADLSGAIMMQANLQEARLRQANLSNTNLRSANLDGANLAYITYNQKSLFPEGFDVAAAARTVLDWYPLPNDPTDVEGWDVFWKQMTSDYRVEYDLYPFFDESDILIPLLQQRGCQTILCAGNGIAVEPYMLAYLGFSVTGLDISSQATKYLANFPITPKYIKNFDYFQQEQQEETQTEFSEQVIKKIKSVKLVTGDIFQRQHCPGPFDAIITRRTLQCFWRKSPEKIFQGIQALLDRLSPTGLLYFHGHNSYQIHEEIEKWLANREVLVAKSMNDIGNLTNQRLFYLRQTSG